jgi:hypothetical protein
MEAGMATKVLMKNPENGLVRNGFFGFSWTYFFFGWWVPLIRGELTVAALHLVFTIFTFGFWQLIVCFLYNKQYTARLIAQGYKFADRHELNLEAARRVGADLSIAALPIPGNSPGLPSTRVELPTHAPR